MNNFIVHTLHGIQFITRVRINCQIIVLLNSMQCARVNIHEMTTRARFNCGINFVDKIVFMLLSGHIFGPRS